MMLIRKKISIKHLSYIRKQLNVMIQMWHITQIKQLFTMKRKNMISVLKNAIELSKNLKKDTMIMLNLVRHLQEKLMLNLLKEFSKKQSNYTKIHY
jgi:hypothetical protein